MLCQGKNISTNTAEFNFLAFFGESRVASRWVVYFGTHLLINRVRVIFLLSGGFLTFFGLLGSYSG
jgi:hypothetical protein